MSGNLMFELQLTMFIMLAIGFFCAKRGMFTKEGRECLVSIFINVMIPCSVVSAFYKNMTQDLLGKGGLMVLAFTADLTFCWLIGKVLYIKIRSDEQGILKYATIISNAQFMGFPIIQAIFGQEGLMLASMAIEYHRSLRGKQQVHSVLDDIEGIGETRRKALMRRFKSLEAVRDATLEELEQTESMNRVAAQKVYDFFH